MIGGGGGPIFICENHRKINKIMHCVEFFLSASFKIWPFFTEYNLVIIWGGGALSALYRSIDNS